MFLDTLTEFQSGIRKGLNKEQIRQEKVILQKISKLQSGVWDASTVTEQNEKQRKLLEAEGELDQFILDLKFQNPQYAQLKYPEPYEAGKIQKQLDEKTVLLEFFLGEKKSFVFAVTSKGLQIGSLPGRAELQESIQKYLERIRIPQKTSLGKDTNRLLHSYRQQAYTLFHLLISPVQPHLKGKEHLILILDGILHYVPFETLITDEDRLLIEDSRVAYAPSATIWVTLQKKPKQRNLKALIAFADPVLASGPSRADEKLQNARLDNLVRLQYTREEVERIASLYPEHLREIYVANEANEAKFRNEEISQYEVVHFATHALIDEEVPRRSGIVLTPETNNESDGILQMHEIWNLNLNTRLVVLSACDTGLGKLVSGEGIVSMMRSFFYAGTKNVVVSLWNVDDNSTADLMKDFYVHMKSGRDPAESLRQAKLNMIQKAKSGSSYAAFEQPYYWAPFILVGPGN
ncbi:CHAT domain-containing protein [bacterium]|nr:CHAT domain-containing protein [bacterium]